MTSEYMKRDVVGIDDKYLYLNPAQILHLPSFDQLPCKQHFPNEIHGASAAVVPYHGVDHLMICGGQKCIKISHSEKKSFKMCLIQGKSFRCSWKISRKKRMSGTDREWLAKEYKHI